MSRQPEKPRHGAGQTDEAFLSRWSRLKADEGADKAVAAVAPETAAPEESTEGGRLTEEEIVASLPDIETLEEVSDFTPFLRDGVPELLKRQALRRLWRVNPVFAEIDGLAEYAEDYTEAASALAEVKTAYKVGRGYLDRDSEDEATAEAPPEADAGEGPEVTCEAAGDDAPESEDTPPLACGPQEAEIADPQSASPNTAIPRTDVASAGPETGVSREPAQTTDPASPVRERGRAAARRWGLPEQ